ncbi:MAG TPA: hypothetical protein VIX86_18625 [Streptosporangiaceae bacterium]
MDRVGLDDIERELDAEARERFPGDAVRQVVLLQYGDDPEIEPGDLWVRVLLAADGPDDYERSVRAFQHDHEAAMEEFADHLAGKLREIRLVEFTCEKTVGRDGHGPRCSLLVGQRLADARGWELGERTQVDMHTTLGRSGLETVDTLIMAGIADTRADAIGWALARIRERPAYERLRERIREIDQLRKDF